MKIEVICGNIVAQPDVDAIVNSANANLRFGSGVAGAIHTAAGQELEVYCQPFAPLPLGGALTVMKRVSSIPDDERHCEGVQSRRG